MITSTQIKADLPVVCSKDAVFGTVDHMEGTDTIKLKKDKTGQHHYIPLKWVTKVDDKVHIGRSGDQAMRDWSTTPNNKSAKLVGESDGEEYQGKENQGVDASGGDQFRERDLRISREEERKTLAQPNSNSRENNNSKL